MTDNKFVVNYAKLGTSSCKKCKQKIAKTALRIGKVTPNPFSDDGGEMKQWFHPACIFETFVRARATTKKIEEPEDLEGFGDLEDQEKDIIKGLIDGYLSKAGSKPSPKPKKTVQTTLSGPSPAKPKTPATPTAAKPSTSAAKDQPSTSISDDPDAVKDNSFRQFRRLCAQIAEESSHLGKTALVKQFITKGSGGQGYKGDLYLIMKMLLPGVVKSVYNLNSKQLVKLFSEIFSTNLSKMIEDLDQGDVAETVRIFFEESRSSVAPVKKCNLSLHDVDGYLIQLAQFTKEDDQKDILAKIAKRCTANDLKMIVRLIKHDLRIGSGAKHILDSLDENAYQAFQASRDLRDVVDRVLEQKEDKTGMKKKLSVRAALMTPVLPMLAEACRSVDQAMKKCPNGFYAEIKYDGERVQVHKEGNEFRYYSRSLKPVQDHKVKLFREFIPKAFPTGSNLILDAEVLLVDTNTGNPLPFGTLGVHKRAAFQDAQVCLFIFDCLLINDENLMEKPLKERRRVLEKKMNVVKNRVNLSEIKHITKPTDLQDLMARVFREGLEGLVLKDVNGAYEPGKRHWLKVKKDYLHEGSMADSADLVVLGAFYGTGNKGGMMSIYLMGVYDPDRKRWVTVSKVGNGFDDATLAKLNKELDMIKISKDFTKVPKWLHIYKSLTPDFVVADPKKAPVWEIIGAEFSKAEIHTADGISIRFPRVQKMRDDKSWREATDLPRLKQLFKESKEKTDGDLTRALGNSNNNTNDDSDVEIKVKTETEVKKETKYDSGSKTANVSGVKATKRKVSNEEDSPPLKKASKPMCRFGADCYQKSGKHLAEFDHLKSEVIKEEIKAEQTSSQTSSKKFNSISTSSSKLEAQSSSSDLLNIFQGCRVVLPSSVDKFRELKRFIIAFDGDIVHEFEASTATHVVVCSSVKGVLTSGSEKVQHVKSDWLWACIRKRRLVNTSPYKT